MVVFEQIDLAKLIAKSEYITEAEFLNSGQDKSRYCSASFYTYYIFRVNRLIKKTQGENLEIGQKIIIRHAGNTGSYLYHIWRLTQKGNYSWRQYIFKSQKTLASKQKYLLFFRSTIPSSDQELTEYELTANYSYLDLDTSSVIEAKIREFGEFGL